MEKDKNKLKSALNIVYIVLISFLLSLFIIVINYVTMTNRFIDIENSLKSKNDVGDVVYIIKKEPYSKSNVKNLSKDSSNKDLIIYEFNNKTILLHNNTPIDLILDKEDKIEKTSDISSLFVLNVFKDFVSIVLIIFICSFFYFIDKFRRKYMDKKILKYYENKITKNKLIKFYFLNGIVTLTLVKFLAYFVYIYDTTFLIVTIYATITFVYIILNEIQARSKNMKEVLKKEYDKIKKEEEKERKRLDKFEKKREKNKDKEAILMSKDTSDKKSDEDENKE